MKPNINNGHYDRSHSHKLSVMRLILMWTYALPKVESEKLAFFIQKTKLFTYPSRHWNPRIILNALYLLHYFKISWQLVP